MSNQKHNDKSVAKICAYIDAHLGEDLSYERLRALFSVSQYVLTAKFPQQVGMPLTKYVIAKRLDRVVELVKSGNGIYESAFHVGFHTYSHFYSEFVKRFGAAPKAYFSKK